MAYNDPNQQQGFYASDYNYGNQGYDLGQDQFHQDGSQFPQDTQFGQFDYSQTSQGYGAPPGGGASYLSQQSAYTGNIMTPDPMASYSAPADGADDYENEPPLMEELGINFEHIKQKTLGVLNPMQTPDVSVMQDTDLAGPLVFCLAFGGSLLLAGKVHFGYIYGIGVIGCFAMYSLLNLMSMSQVSVGIIISVLGYCLLPMVLLSFFAVLFSLQGIMGTVLTPVTVAWCSICASKFFVTALSMDHQQPLVAYPCALVYGVFALLTVF